MPESEWVDVDGTLPMVDEQLLTDLSVIGEVTNPIRSSLLFRLRRPRSAAELADDMNVPVTRLYHHLNRLEALGLITVVATRRSGAKTERRYRNVAAGFRLDPEVVSRVDPLEFSAAIAALFDVAKRELVHEFEVGTLHPERLKGMSTIGLNELTLTVEQRQEFIAKLGALLDEYITHEHDRMGDAPDAHRFRIFIAGFPVSN